MDSGILDQLEALYEEELTLVQEDLGQSETCVRAIIKSIGVGLLAAGGRARAKRVSRQRDAVSLWRLNAVCGPSPAVGSHAAGLDYDSSGLLSLRRMWA